MHAVAAQPIPQIVIMVAMARFATRL